MIVKAAKRVVNMKAEDLFIGCSPGCLMDSVGGQQTTYRGMQLLLVGRRMQ